ncbi:MAG: hypothetical protein LC768_05205 [Acidobacteria bacterium]|nr:hypothetical protein [Acidobacteriota bacterium]MCA1637724.1 hypothetical protein [Acidobacteriota bacterium]
MGKQCQTSGGNSKQRRAAMRQQSRNPNQSAIPKPAPKVVLPKAKAKKTDKTAKSTIKTVTISTPRPLFSENNLVLGGAAMIVTAYGALLFNASAIYSGILFIVGLIMFILALYRHDFFEGKAKILQQYGNPFISIVIAVVFAVSWVSLQPAPIKLRAYLVHANEPDPINPCGDIPPEAITIYYGSAASFTTGNNLRLIDVDDKPLISAKKTSSGLLISLRLFDSKGNEIATIVDNKFIGNVADNLEIRLDSHTIDIFDKDNDHLIFHIRYLNSKAIKILGTFYYPNRENLLDIDENRVLLPRGNKFGNVCLGGVGEATMIGF